MSSILNYIEENPQETQRLIGLEYGQLQQLIQNAEKLHNRPIRKLSPAHRLGSICTYVYAC